MAGELLVIVPGALSIGVRMQQARDLTDASLVIGYIIVVLVIGILIDVLFNAADNALRKRWGLTGTGYRPQPGRVRLTGTWSEGASTSSTNVVHDCRLGAGDRHVQHGRRRLADVDDRHRGQLVGGGQPGCVEMQPELADPGRAPPSVVISSRIGSIVFGCG